MPESSSAVQSLIAQRIRPDVRAMHAYTVQDSTGLIKLDAMENPHRLSPDLQAKLGVRLGAVALNRYPGARIEQLKAELKRFAQCPEGYDIVLGNGSDELISLLALASQTRDENDGAQSCILAPLPGFVMYGLSAQLQGLRFVGVDLGPDFELDEAAMLDAILEHKPVVTYLAYPNNPTANLWDDGVMLRIIQTAATVNGIVVIDEAYQPFASKSFLSHLSQHPNVILMRTLSKFGLAGIRLGYMLGRSELMHEVDKVRPPYNVNVLSAECAFFALEHQDAFAAQAADICAEREKLLGVLGRMEEVVCYPSQANMILIRVADADKTFADLRSQGVLVKNVSASHPLLKNCLRLTVGTADENHAMLTALQRALNSLHSKTNP